MNRGEAETFLWPSYKNNKNLKLMKSLRFCNQKDLRRLENRPLKLWKLNLRDKIMMRSLSSIKLFSRRRENKPKKIKRRKCVKLSSGLVL
jgi:hypothetical protein